jgi:heterodisulfide reductase subunit A
MSVARAALLEPLPIKTVEVEPRGLVLGGGISGLRAAIDIGSRGFDVTLVERESEVGGHLGKLSTLYPHYNAASDVIDRMKLEVLALDNVEILTDSEVVDFEGYIGNFVATIKNMKTNESNQIKVGTAIVATGFEPYEPAGIYGFGEHVDIITLAKLEEEKKRDKGVLRFSTAWLGRTRTLFSLLLYSYGQGCSRDERSCR